MADPREYVPAVNPVRQREVMSPLMRAKAASLDGQAVNFCPFGCTAEKLDEHGYCNHLIGFSNDKVTYEPMVRHRANGRRVVQVRTKPVGQEYDDLGNVHAVVKPVNEECLPTDKFVQITTSWRVYRKLPNDREDAGPAPPPLPANKGAVDYKGMTPQQVQALIDQAMQRPGGLKPSEVMGLVNRETCGPEKAAEHMRMITKPSAEQVKEQTDGD